MSIFDVLLKKHKINDSVVKNLTEVVNLKSGVETKFDRSYYRFGFVNQVDLLYLSEDETKIGKHAKYALVVVDIGSGACDIRALASRSSNVVLKALKDIYASGKYLKEPKRIHCDQGTENALFASYFKTRNIGVRYSAVNRHKQNSLVEAMNKTIGSVIGKLQLNNEIASGLEDTAWVEYLPDILELINDNAKKNHPKDLPILDEQAKFTPSLCKGDECDILFVGDDVLTSLDYPQDFQGKRLHGVFRSADRRWGIKPHKIEQVLTFSHQPIRYVVEGFKNNTFSKAELKPYFSKNQQKMKLTNQQQIIDKFLDKKTDKFLVKWENEDTPTWEPAIGLPKELIDEYDEKHGTKTILKGSVNKPKRYEIEKFVDERIVKKQKQYRVKYIGYDKKQDERWYNEKQLRTQVNNDSLFDKFVKEMVYTAEDLKPPPRAILNL